MKRVAKGFLFVLSLFLSVWVIEETFAEVAIIINPQNAISSLSGDELKQIYQGKKEAWKWGGKIFPGDLAKGNEARQRFSTAILGKTPEAMDMDYLQRSLTGQGQIPRILSSSQEMKNFVKTNRNAIGYIDAKDVDGSVKVIQVDGKDKL